MVRGGAVDLDRLVEEHHVHNRAEGRRSRVMQTCVAQDVVRAIPLMAQRPEHLDPDLSDQVPHRPFGDTGTRTGKTLASIPPAFLIRALARPVTGSVRTMSS